MNHWSKAIVLGAAGAAIGVAAIAQVGAPQAKREILQRQDIAGTDRETVIGAVEFPPGAAVGRHRHPGEETGYVLKGPLVLKIDGRPDTMLQTGQSYAVAAGLAHDAHGSEGGAKVVAVWTVQKGKPLATPAD